VRGTEGWLHTSTLVQKFTHKRQVKVTEKVSKRALREINKKDLLRNERGSNRRNPHYMRITKIRKRYGTPIQSQKIWSESTFIRKLIVK